MAGGKRDSSEIAPAYLIAGTDEAKLDATLARLRARAESEGGAGALQSFSPPPGSSAGPDAEGLVASIPAMSLTSERRYLLAEGVERWSAKQAAPVAEAIGALPPDVTVVLVAREQPPKLRAPKRLAEAVEAAGGEVLTYAAPKPRELPRWLADEAAGAASSSSPTRRSCWASGSATRPPGWRPSSTGSRCGPSPGARSGAGPRGDGRRHVRGGRVGALGRDRRPRRRGRRWRRPSGSPRRESR